jgi:hypothetical protein
MKGIGAGTRRPAGRALPIFNGVTTSSRLQRLLAFRPNPFLLRIIITHTITPIMYVTY